MRKMYMRFAQLNGPGDEDETTESTATEEAVSEGAGDTGGDDAGE